MLPPKLFGVNLPQTNRLKLRNQIRNLAKFQKATLYFFYSEFLLRANRNPAYREVLNRGILTAIDGKGLHWSMSRIMQPGFLARLYTGVLVKAPFTIRALLFPIPFLLEFIWNIFLSATCLVFKLDLAKPTENELVLGRDFSYDLLTLAEENNWKTLIIGGASNNSQEVLNTIHRLYPSLELDIWSKPYDSDLMRDKAAGGQDLLKLNSYNLPEYFPDLIKAKTHVDIYKPDLILVCLGGASGKQEFFIDNLYRDNSIDFTLATGIGAALDHLGAGAQQPKSPRWLTNVGLEWFYRLLKQPYRRKRILDSIYTLWWWTTLQEFMPEAKASRQFVNIISDPDNKYLVQETEKGLEFLMVPVSRKDAIKKNFLKTSTRTGLQFNLLDFDPKPLRLSIEKLPVNLRVFADYLFKYSSREPFISQVHYMHSASNNGLLAKLKWVSVDELVADLAYEHKRYWQAYLESHKE